MALVHKIISFLSLAVTVLLRNHCRFEQFRPAQPDCLSHQRHHHRREIHPLPVQYSSQPATRSHHRNTTQHPYTRFWDRFRLPIVHLALSTSAHMCRIEEDYYADIKKRINAPNAALARKVSILQTYSQFIVSANYTTSKVQRILVRLRCGLWLSHMVTNFIGLKRASKGRNCLKPNYWIRF